MRVLPIILLGTKVAWKEDLKATSAELVYGEPLRLPREFLTERQTIENTVSEFQRDILNHFNQLRPVNKIKHEEV